MFRLADGSLRSCDTPRLSPASIHRPRAAAEASFPTGRTRDRDPKGVRLLGGSAGATGDTARSWAFLSKLLVTSATLVVTGALLVVTKSY